MILLPLLLAMAAPRAQALGAPGDQSCADWTRHIGEREQAGDTARAEGRAEIAAGGDGSDALMSMMRKESAYAADQAWLAGFLSGLALQSRGAIRLPDMEKAGSGIASYCTDHPRASVEDAAARLVRPRRRGQ